MAAADLAERAAELMPATDQSFRLRRLITAAEAAMAVGDGPRARGPLEEVAARAEAGPLRADALHKLAYLVSDDSALRLAEAALDEAGTDDALLADIELSASLFAVMGGDGTALRRAEAAVRHAEAAGQPFLLSQALSNIAFLRRSGCAPAPSSRAASRPSSYAATAASNSRASSPAVCCRSPGALASARSTASPSDGGSPGRTASSAGGGSWMCAHSFSTSLSLS